MKDLKLNEDRETLKRVLEHAIPQTLQDVALVYASVSDVGRTRQDNNLLDPRRYALDPAQGGGLTALRVKDGSKVRALSCARGACEV